MTQKEFNLEEIRKIVAEVRLHLIENKDYWGVAHKGDVLRRGACWLLDDFTESFEREVRASDGSPLTLSYVVNILFDRFMRKAYSSMDFRYHSVRVRNFMTGFMAATEALGRAFEYHEESALFAATECEIATIERYQRMGETSPYHQLIVMMSLGEITQLFAQANQDNASLVGVIPLEFFAEAAALNYLEHHYRNILSSIALELEAEGWFKFHEDESVSYSLRKCAEEVLQRVGQQLDLRHSRSEPLTFEGIEAVLQNVYSDFVGDVFKHRTPTARACAFVTGGLLVLEELAGRMLPGNSAFSQQVPTYWADLKKIENALGDQGNGH